MRGLVLGTALLAASCQAGAAGEPNGSQPSSRFAVRGAVVEARPAIHAGQRFALGAQLQRHSGTASIEAQGFSLRAELGKELSGTCTIPLLLFRDGFEAVP